MTRFTRPLFALCALSTALGCAETLAPDDAGVPTSSGAFTHEVAADGTITTVVDASDADAWRHLDLDTGDAVDASSDRWDLAFRRFFIRTNGGVSGSGGVQVARASEPSFEAVTRAPETGWSTDRPDGDADEDTQADSPFNDGVDDWYAYDEVSHMLTPRDRTYVVASTEGRFFKLRIDSYYDDAGSPATLRFRAAEVPGPSSSLPDAGPGGGVDAGPPPDAGPGVMVPADAITVDASSGEWVYLSVSDGVVTPSDPSTSTAWDLAFSRADIRTCSGTSGVGLAGARAAPAGVAFEDLERATTLGYRVDAVRAGGPGGPMTSVNPVLDGWYDYDVTTHSLSPGARSYLVRTASGDYARLRIWTWVDGVFELSLSALEREVVVVELEVDAGASDEWTHVSLRDGALVEVGDAASDARWDLAISRTRMRTNGGTSGAGQGAAVETTMSTLEALVDVPAEGWSEDVDTLSDGAPGAPPYSGNAELGGWYTYDPASHSVSPRAVAFAVRTADGGYAKVRVRSYADGVYQLALAYAGAGRESY